MASQPADPPFFTYNPLPDAATHIRLLQILSLNNNNDDDDNNNQVHAQLTVWPRATAPAYHAISYTWGDPNETTTVLINGGRMVVRRNCEYVLKQAKWYDDDDGEGDDDDEGSRGRGRERCDKRGRSCYFWCDAICIDQGNNGEKAFQVAMMGAIYKGAVRVLACVGEAEGGSEVLFGELRRREAWLLRAVAALESGRAIRASKNHEDGLVRIGFNVAPAKRSIINSLLLSGCSAVWKRIRRRSLSWPQVTPALLALAKRDYFRRVWIYQELFLGSEVLLCCGMDTAPLRVLYGMLQVVYGTSKRARRHGLASRGQRQGLGGGLGLCEDMVEAGSVPGLVGMKFFWEALYTVSMLDCTDARDRVYGVLSLVEWGLDETPIFPDYDLGAFELAVEVLRRLGTFHRVIVMRSLGLAVAVSALPSEGLLEARRRRRRSMTAPLVYEANAPEIPDSVPDKTDLLTHSFGLCVYEDADKGRLYFGLPAAIGMGIEIGIHRWPVYRGQRDDKLWAESQARETAMAVLVPFDTGPGDWCIFYRSEFYSGGWLVLVAQCVDEIEETGREKSTRSHRFMIKGKGLAFVEGIITKDPSDDSGKQPQEVEGKFLNCLRQFGMSFDVYCDAEDALCLESSFISEGSGSEHVKLQDGFLSEYFDTGVCGKAASSFALDIYYRGREWTA